MENLIKALQIFLKYGNPNYPTHCEHDVLCVVGIDKNLMTQTDIDELESLSFVWEGNYFQSFHYGSA